MSAESDRPLKNFLGLLRRNGGKSAIAAGLFAILAWTVWPQADEPQRPATLQRVIIGDIEKTVSAAGTLQAGGLIDVGAQVSGQLRKMHVKLGDRVSEGDLLAEIDDFIQRTRVDSARAHLESLEANSSAIQGNLALAESQLRRQERLMKADATTGVEFDIAVVNLTQAKANLTRHVLQIEQARANLEEASARLGFTRIMAPSGGTVVDVLLQEGQTLNASQTTPIVLRIGNLTKIRVLAKISEVDIQKLAPGTEAFFTTLNGDTRRWWTSLDEISPLPATAPRPGAAALFDGILEIDNADGILLPGMNVSVFFLTSYARNVLKLPLSSLEFAPVLGGNSALEPNPVLSMERRNLGINEPASAPGRTDLSRRATVRILGPDGQIDIRRVQVGIDNGVEAEIISGVAKGETVLRGAR